MPTYRLKPTVKQTNYVPTMILGNTFGEILAILSERRVFWVHTIDECASGDTPLAGCPEFIAEVEDVSLETAKRCILAYFGAIPGPSGYWSKVTQIPNFGNISCDRLLPVYWVVRGQESWPPGDSDNISDIDLLACTGGNHGDDFFLYYSFQSAIEALGLQDIEDWRDFRDLSVDTQFDVLSKMLEIGPYDEDVSPSQYGRGFFCQELGELIPFVNVGNDMVDFSNISIFCQNGDSDEWVVIQFKSSGRSVDDPESGFAGRVSLLGTVIEGFDVTPDNVHLGNGLLSSKCDWEAQVVEPVTLEHLYEHYTEIRKYIEVIPDPEPKSLRAIKRNSIRAF